MDKTLLQKLEHTLNEVTATLPKVSAKKMFGCHALLANENMFALVWKHGRIGFKIPDDIHYQKLMKIKGSEPWVAGNMQMTRWVLVPESFHAKPAELKKWASQAHALCLVLEKKAKPKTTRKTASKK